LDDIREQTNVYARLRRGKISGVIGATLQEVSFMLVNAADMLKKAEAGKYGLGAFNTNNLEWTLAILQAAEEAKSPLILQCTAGAAKWMGGFKVCADMVKASSPQGQGCRRGHGRYRSRRPSPRSRFLRGLL